MSSLTSLDDPGQITWFDSCNLSHSEMEEFKGKETTVVSLPLNSSYCFKQMACLARTSKDTWVCKEIKYLIFVVQLPINIM